MIHPELAQILRAGVSSVTSDSRQVRAGTLFVAVRGTSQDGHLFIGEAISRGAVAVVCEAAANRESRVPFVVVPDSRLALSQAAAFLNGEPSRAMKVIGVTGTSGKTTTTYLIESILRAAGEKVGVLGTVNFRFEGEVLPSTHTTPGPVELQQTLALMRARGCTAVVMEVSSHALRQKRAASVAFDAVVFTNLSPEHLDFHPDMEDYFDAKAILFTELAEHAVECGKKPVAAINLDEDYGRRLLDLLKTRRAQGKVAPRSFSFSVESANSDFSGSALSCTGEGIRGQVGSVRIESEMAGAFNASNIMAAVSACASLGIHPSSIEKGVRELGNVPGRLERVSNDRGIHVFVDYAHKPDALEKVLKALSSVKGEHRLITVFGCGGDRDRTKRPVMGALSVDLSDHAIVTSDNPRTENPSAIIEEIVSQIRSRPNLSIEPDRRQAIFAAIGMARSGDIVLLAGKGHEDYQIIADPAASGGTRKIHFDDREVAAEALASVDS